MENEQNQGLEPEEEIKEEGEEGEEIIIEDEEKPKLTPEQIKGIKQRKFTKLAKELGIELPKPESEKKIEKKDFDYAEKAYLKSSGIPKEDFQIVWDAMQATGKSLDDVLESKYIQNELKEAKENRDSKNAIPSGAKRSAPSSRDDVAYWLNKGELPPKDQVELRRKVVEAKIKKETNTNMFS